MIPTNKPINITLYHTTINNIQQTTTINKLLKSITKPINFEPLTKNNPPNYPKILKTKIIHNPTKKPFTINVFTQPKINT